jgi:hypothetical protein
LVQRSTSVVLAHLSALFVQVLVIVVQAPAEQVWVAVQACASTQAPAVHV